MSRLKVSPNELKCSFISDFNPLISLLIICKPGRVSASAWLAWIFMAAVFISLASSKHVFHFTVLCDFRRVDSVFPDSLTSSSHSFQQFCIIRFKLEFLGEFSNLTIGSWGAALPTPTWRNQNPKNLRFKVVILWFDVNGSSKYVFTDFFFSLWLCVSRCLIFILLWEWNNQIDQYH